MAPKKPLGAGVLEKELYRLQKLVTLEANEKGSALAGELKLSGFRFPAATATE